MHHIKGGINPAPTEDTDLFPLLNKIYFPMVRSLDKYVTIDSDKNANTERMRYHG